MSNHHTFLRRRRLTVAALLVLLAVPALAQAAPLEFLFRDPETRELFGTFGPNETLTVGVGETLRVAAYSYPGSRRVYPRARYTILEGHRVIDIERLGRDDASGTMLLRGGHPGDAVIGYELLTEQGAIDARDRSGRFRVRVVSGARQGGGAVSSFDPYAGTNQQRAWQVVDSLYRGILLRRPEDAQPERVRAIQSGGRDAAERMALDIAGSAESQEIGYEVEPEQRTAALYRHLLGLEASQVPSHEWGRTVRLIELGRISEAVTELVRRDGFARHLGLDTRYGWLR